MNGPLKEDEKAENIASFSMNAVQFEYGVNMQFRIMHVDSVLAYNRSSQHPLRERYSEVATEQIIYRIKPDHSFGNSKFTILPVARFSYVDLFDFWESELPKPKTRYSFVPQLIIEYNLTASYLLYVAPEIDVIYTKDRTLELDYYLESGVKKIADKGIDVFFQYYRSNDTEILESRQHKAQYIGFAVRFRGI